MRRFLPLIFFVSAIAATARAQTAVPIPGPATASDGISSVLRRFEALLEAGDAAGYTALLVPGAHDETREEFVADWLAPGITRAVVHERLRAPVDDVPAGDAYQVYVDVLTEFGKEGLVGTWLIDFRRDAGTADTWHISDLTVLTVMRGLHRLDLNRQKEFNVDNLTLSAEDFEVRLPHGVAFVAETDDGTTGMVLLGKGDLTFAPTPEAEKGQVKIFSGADVLRTSFDWLYVRARPDEFDDHVPPAALAPRPVDPRDLKRADAVFNENLSLSFGLDLGDLSREKWSVLPKTGDFVTEIQTGKRHLTYMRSASEPEDIRFFDRTRLRTISVYASADKLEARGRFFSEDDQIDYDILHYDIDASFDPRREWIDGTASVYLIARRPVVSTLIMTLAEPLVIRSVVSRRFGYLMALRVSGQDQVVINLPEPLTPDTILDLTFTYGGRLHAVPPEREALELAQAQDQQEQNQSEFFTFDPEPSYIYTGRSEWYPQGRVTDYATANLSLRVPETYSTVASGALDEGFPKLVPSDVKDVRAWKEYHFSATQPVRYLGWATSRFLHVDDATVSIANADAAPDSSLTGVSYNEAALSVESSNLLRRRALNMSVVTQDVMTFYAALLGDLPYQSFTLALVERAAPGGHSPPYFAALSQPPPITPVYWRDDPTYFNDYPEFFVAHEAAHQWWGHAVGWKNYHEQWLSEGFAQYFAALYAERAHRPGVFEDVIGQMTRWAIDKSSQGPVYLGYRLGHIRGDSRVFRAVIYNKGALILHMLRRLVGDEVFFRSLRRYYATWRFKKAGTEDLRAAFEAESHRSLARFFDRWIYGAALPRVKFSYTIEPGAVAVRFEQVGDVFDVPVTVTLEYANRSTDVIVALDRQVTELRIPSTGPVKDVEANRDDAAPVIFVK